MRIYNNWSKKIRYSTLGAVLCLFIGILSAQVRPGQLRKEVLNSQKGIKTNPTKKTKNKIARPIKPLPAAKPLAPIANPLQNKTATLVFLENTESLAYDQFVNPDMKILKGNVRFKHDNTLLYCDSAYFYEKANSIDAFSNVRIVQGDTMTVYGDFLFYDGNMKLAKLRRNVKLVNKKTTLTTDSLNYDRITSLAYYYTGGKIVDPENTLTSIWGQYHTTTNDAIFKNKVVLTNKNYVMNSDTLIYNTNTSFANIVGPTKIVYQNETDILSSKGWYNTKGEQMMLLNRSIIKHKDGNTITGDTVFYDKVKKQGEAFINVVLVDSTQKSTLTGDYVFYDEIADAGFATDSAMLLDWSSKDSMWIHADTLKTFKDSIYNGATGYANVRIFRNDVQGICDTLYYSARDSVINLRGEPVLWSDNNQLSGEVIKAFSENKKIKRIQLIKSAMAIQREDSISFNQLSGKEIIAHLDSSQLRKVNVNGNAETIFYPRDDKDSTLVGLNKTESSFVTLYIKNKKMERIVMTSASSGIMYPLGQLKGGETFLKNFFWLEKERPLTSADVLKNFPKAPRPKIGTSSIMGAASSDEKKPKNKQ